MYPRQALYSLQSSYLPGRYYMCIPPCLVYVVLVMEPSVLCMLSKHSASKATPTVPTLDSLQSNPSLNPPDHLRLRQSSFPEVLLHYDHSRPSPGQRPWSVSDLWSMVAAYSWAWSPDEETRKLGQTEAAGSIFSPSLEDTLGWRCMGKMLKREGSWAGHPNHKEKRMRASGV